jgi:hypothetical protein
MKYSRTETTNPNQLGISLVKKSVANRTWRWTRMNSCHVTVFLRSGAGRML